MGVYFVGMPAKDPGSGGDYYCGAWTDCDMYGCQANAYDVDSEMMCPNERCTINTNKPFQISHSQMSDKATVTLEQEGRMAKFDVCKDYIADMSSSLEGMVFSVSIWGGGGIDMDWLDGMTGCTETCDLEFNSLT